MDTLDIYFSNHFSDGKPKCNSTDHVSKPNVRHNDHRSNGSAGRVNGKKNNNLTHCSEQSAKKSVKQCYVCGLSSHVAFPMQ